VPAHEFSECGVVVTNPGQQIGIGPGVRDGAANECTQSVFHGGSRLVFFDIVAADGTVLRWIGPEWK
jgi:hypothetical protein